MSKTRNLYRVTTVGLGSHYVVATDPTSAYEGLRREWDDRNYGLGTNRGMVSIELLATEEIFCNSEPRLRIV